MDKQESIKPAVKTVRKHSGNGDKFDHYVLQGHYGGGARWEDLTAGESLDMILQSEDDYKRNVPNIPLRLISVWKTPSTGQEKRYTVKKYSAWFDYPPK